MGAGERGRRTCPVCGFNESTCDYLVGFFPSPLPGVHERICATCYTSVMNTVELTFLDKPDHTRPRFNADAWDDLTDGFPGRIKR